MDSVPAARKFTFRGLASLQPRHRPRRKDDVASSSSREPFEVIAMSQPGRFLLRSIGVGFLLCSFGCGESDVATPPQPKPSPKPTAKVPADKPPTDKAAESAAKPKKPTLPTSTVEWKRAASKSAGRGLGFVTKEAWMAIRMPDPASIGASFQATAIGQALSRFDLFAGERSPADWIAKGKEKIAEKAPEYLRLVEELLAARGEVVVALLDVDPSRLDRGSEFPLTAAAFVELGDAARSIGHTLRSIAATPELAPGVVTRGDDLWLLQDEGFRLEVMLHEGYLCVLVGPPAEYAPILDDLAVLKPQDSFLGNSVLAATPFPLGESSQVFGETYVSLASLPSILEAYAPEARQYVTDLGFDSIQGSGIRTAFDGDLISDSYALVSPGRKDPITMCFESGGLDASFARYSMADAEDVSLIHFDFAGALTKWKRGLSERPRAALVAGLEEANRGLGMDLERDVLALFGSQFAFSMKGSFALLSKDPEQACEMALAIELKDGARFAKWMERMIADGFVPASPRKLGERKAYKVGVPLPGAPSWLEICFAWTDDAFVVASTFDALTRVIETADSGVIPDRIAKVLSSAPRDAFGASVSSAAADVRSFFAIVRAGLDEASAKAGTPNDFPLPSADALEAVIADLGDSMRFYRATDAGLEVDQRSPIGNPSLLAMPISVVAAVAIPNLLSARLGANERAAVATLRSMMSAQVQFQTIGVVDEDGDGLGEYASFCELMGTVALPDGRALDPPLLSPRTGTFVEGRLEKNGYYYRVFLPGRNGEPIREKAEGGRDGAIDAENAEIAFAIYAWPKEYGSSGFNTYMIDAEGEVLQAAPNGRAAPYAGTSDEPEGDSAFATRNTMLRTDAMVTGVRGGPRGVVWVPVR